MALMNSAPHFFSLYTLSGALATDKRKRLVMFPLNHLSTIAADWPSSLCMDSIKAEEGVLVPLNESLNCIWIVPSNLKPSHPTLLGDRKKRNEIDEMNGQRIASWKFHCLFQLHLCRGTEVFWRRSPPVVLGWVHFRFLALGCHRRQSDLIKSAPVYGAVHRLPKDAQVRGEN